MVEILPRDKRLHRLNGRLASILRQLGSCVGESRLICNSDDDMYKYLSKIHDLLKSETNRFHDKYLK